MLSLSFRFTAGRYHATKWGTNVNEGIADWPPSPWRILRAIISAWKSKATHITDDTMRPIIESMSKSPVLFVLPSAQKSHTRHYMPTKGGATTKVIDAFLTVDKNGILVATWKDVCLDDGQKKVLADVVSRVGYLGRAESWCEVTVDEERREHNCLPLGADAGGGELTDILVPDQNVTLEDLCSTTEDLHRDGRIYPRSSKRATYVLPTGCFDAEPTRREPATPKVQVLRYQIVGTVLPSVTESMPVGDFIRRVAMCKYGEKNDGKTSGLISGKDGDGNSLKGHTHAFFIPTDEDDDRKLDHLTIVSEKQFDKEDFDALISMTQVRYKPKWFGLIYQGYGMKSDFSRVPILKRSRRWRSATPFVLNRHPKTKRGLDTDLDEAKKQILLELERRFGDMTSTKIEVHNSKSLMQSGLMPIQFKRWRKHGILGIGAYQASVEFDKPISGPLSLGHGAHFGLGLFVPVVE